MKKQLVIISTLAIIMTLSFVACDSDDNPTINIDASSFANFDTWELVKTAEGTDPNGVLLGAHNGELVESVRKIYVKNNQSATDGVYPAGTIVVKHTSTTDGTMTSYQAMVKRESGFNELNNDWEWFKLEADGTIVERGTNIGACGTCHAAAETDYVFSK